MTTAEALAVVREALHQAVGFDRAGSLVSHPYEQTYHVIATGCDDALTALALIEERMGEWERMEERWHSVESKVLMHDDALARAEKAEAERDEIRAALVIAHPWNRAYAAEQRVAELEARLAIPEANITLALKLQERITELEAALQGITEAAQAYVRDPSPETWLAGINAARAALGGGE